MFAAGEAEPVAACAGSGDIVAEAVVTGVLNHGSRHIDDVSHRAKPVGQIPRRRAGSIGAGQQRVHGRTVEVSILERARSRKIGVGVLAVEERPRLHRSPGTGTVGVDLFADPPVQGVVGVSHLVIDHAAGSLAGRTRHSVAVIVSERRDLARGGIGLCCHVSGRVIGVGGVRRCRERAARAHGVARGVPVAVDVVGVAF